MPLSSRKKLFEPSSVDPYPLSRSKLELFLECPRCFYLDRRIGISRPNSPPYSLNLAVDQLLKKEFDVYRAKQEPHPLMTAYGVSGVPLRHAELSIWRDSPVGIRYIHTSSNIELFGIIDDIWKHDDGTLAMVDYKATSTEAIISLENRDSYRRQLEVYAWLFRQNGFNVSDTGYFVFANGRKDPEMFRSKLEFHMQIIPSRGSFDWIDDALLGAKECLMEELPPQYVDGCEWCGYRRGSVER